MKNVLTCPHHPDRTAVSKGLCRTCYMRQYRNGKDTPPRVVDPVPTCHPDREHRAHGLCKECYLAHYYRDHRHEDVEERVIGENYGRRPTCHPDRPHKARGLCRDCYLKEPDRAAAIKAYTDVHSRRNRLKHHYGLSLDDYDRMFKAQNGRCAICHQPPRGKMQHLSVDHNHTTDQVRGLLCITCNRALGWHENPDWCAEADAYLASYATSTASHAKNP